MKRHVDDGELRGAWAEFCFDPMCSCYGVTIHGLDGGPMHRAFTAVELLAFAGAWSDGAL